MFARAGAAGATRDGAWKDCTKVVARTCHSSGSGKALAQARPVAAPTARERFVRLLRASTRLPRALPCRLRPSGQPRSCQAAAPACLSALKLREIPRYIIYPLFAMRVAVSSLALCGVSSAYQATTARTGALANQVTMMAKSKARPRSLTKPAAAPRSCQACDPAAHTEPLWSTGRADVRCA